MSKHAHAAARLPIDGMERSTAEGRTFSAHSPATGEVLWEVPDAGPEDARAAVHAARNACYGTTWGTDEALRASVLGEVQGVLAAEADHLAEVLAVTAGVPVALRAEHVDGPIAALSAVVPGARGTDPAGVTAVITPATSPLAVALADLGRVLASGGTVVLKPAPEAASAALELARILMPVVPRGVLNVLTTRDVDVAIGLTRDPGVDAVSFTGSSFVGERVREAAGSAGKDVRVTVGGARVVRAGNDAMLAAVVADAARAVGGNAGQACHVPASIVVPVDRHAEAVELAVAAMEGVAVGDPTDPGTLCGPLRSRVALDRVRRYVALARSEGADVPLGGDPLDRDGWWFPPTVVAGLGEQSRVVLEELLGPVVMVVPASWGRA